ncbi:ATP-dependent nuclease [Candidatus Poriferisodalis sp.]|uniref:ATP-dependent nuclease n=1 Tax=Candidatus Poriferisodalis sp. TaxID=3101277 RepID=UPI003B02AAEF
MHIERVTLSNFRCFAVDATTIELDAALTAFVGANGTGKTAVFAALGRMFGVSRAERQVVRDDFHVPIDEAEPTVTRKLWIEAVIAFPELGGVGDAAGAGEGVDGVTEPDPLGGESANVAEFFRQMAANEEGKLKCRFRLDAEWTNDGSVDGTVTETLRAIRTLDSSYGDDDCSPLRPMDRSRIQMVYVPASRDGARHLTAFLKSRLWQAGQWTKKFRAAVDKAAAKVSDRFRAEPVVKVVEGALSERWKHLHRGEFDAQPTFRPMDRDLAQLVGKSQLVFSPSESGRERTADQLSDGQRSLLHIALTAATIDIESKIASGGHVAEFNADTVQLPSLTLLVVEEPENSLSPYFLSRIVSQMLDIGAGARAQALVSSQSSSVLGRVDPRAVRHFRLDAGSLTAEVNCLKLPASADAAATYVREAVQAYPELYFAKFVVLGEGSSERVVIPRLAQATGTSIDQSFVAVVPLGGRHVGHFWRLLRGLGIPHVTLLDLDRGRSGGGAGRIQTTCREFEAVGIQVLDGLDRFENAETLGDLGEDDFEAVVAALQEEGAVFCSPLDLDMSMLNAFPDAYKQTEGDQTGPQATPAFDAVLGANGSADFYESSEQDIEWGEEMRWYRYLFLGRSKPTTHLRALQRLDDETLCADMPKELRKVVSLIREAVGG